MTNKKYNLVKKGEEHLEKFTVTIVADSNDGDYVTTIETYTVDDFEGTSYEEYDGSPVGALIDLLKNFSGSHELENFENDGWISIPSSDWGVCHTLESVTIDYTDKEGCTFEVILNLED